MQNVAPDIPRLYTAIAEWGACVVFISILPKRFSAAYTACICAVMLALQTLFLTATGAAVMYMWILFMLIAVIIMVAYIFFCSRIRWTDAIYCGMHAFVLAEFIASLEWQIYSFYFTDNVNLLKGLPFFLCVCVVFYIFYRWMLVRLNPKGGTPNFNKSEIWPVVLIALLTFTVSNLSFVVLYIPFSTPFTTDYGEAVVIIRTMVDLGGVAVLYAYHVLRGVSRIKVEMSVMQGMLEAQYRQYKQSEESMELVNYKYHDLKHQIAVLRAEEDPEKRNEYMKSMEEEIAQYEAQHKTGNRVLDIMLASKTLTCQKNGISLNCVAEGKLLDFIDTMDLCALLGNAFDNAIESEKKIADPEKRMIHVAIFSQKAFLILRFENYFDGKLDMENGIPVTTKEEKGYHGYGLKSIQHTAKKYGGAANISVQDGWFELKILIPIPDKTARLGRESRAE